MTGFPEMLDGRVKTLHPRIHGGILADLDKTEHRDALADHDITPIDLVVCNLYPFLSEPFDRAHRHWRTLDGARRGEESSPGSAS